MKHLWLTLDRHRERKAVAWVDDKLFQDSFRVSVETNTLKVPAVVSLLLCPSWLYEQYILSGFLLLLKLLKA